MKNLSLQIKMFRKKMEWSQFQLSIKSTLAIDTIMKIEQNHALNPTIKTICKLADAFDITIDKLVGRQEHRTDRRT